MSFWGESGRQSTRANCVAVGSYDKRTEKERKAVDKRRPRADSVCMKTAHTIIRSSDDQRCTISFKFSNTEADVAMQQLPSGRWMVESVAFYSINSIGLSVKTDEPGWLVEMTRRDAIEIAQKA